MSATATLWVVESRPRKVSDGSLCDWLPHTNRVFMQKVTAHHFIIERNKGRRDKLRVAKYIRAEEG